ncbi:hypothetical protein [Brochothrix campestris]|uniref:hypothetical protein n=1 Tax=Brochothrix campestris TaxID=2757 RepID=UPI0018DE5E2B|nr:hypothetical protein [Brochothrix campestris]
MFFRQVKKPIVFCSVTGVPGYLYRAQRCACKIKSNGHVTFAAVGGSKRGSFEALPFFVV